MLAFGSAFGASLDHGHQAPPSQGEIVIHSDYSVIGVALRWNPLDERASTYLDIDLNIHVFKGSDRQTKIVNYNNKTYNKKRGLVIPFPLIHHTGDSLTGEGKHDDERIIVYLKNIRKYKPKIDRLLVSISSYLGQPLDQLSEVSLRIFGIDHAKVEHELFNYTLEIVEDLKFSTGIHMAELYLDQGLWNLRSEGIKILTSTDDDLPLVIAEDLGEKIE